MKTYHLFCDDTETYCAERLEDIPALVNQFCGPSFWTEEGKDLKDWGQVADDEIVKVHEEDFDPAAVPQGAKVTPTGGSGALVEATAAQWATLGPCFICTTEY